MKYSEISRRLLLKMRVTGIGIIVFSNYFRYLELCLFSLLRESESWMYILYIMYQLYFSH